MANREDANVKAACTIVDEIDASVSQPFMVLGTLALPFLRNIEIFSDKWVLTKILGTYLGVNLSQVIGVRDLNRCLKVLKDQLTIMYKRNHFPFFLNTG